LQLEQIVRGSVVVLGPKLKSGRSDEVTSAPAANGSPSAKVSGSFRPNASWDLDFSFALLDTEYLDIGVPPANGSGLQPGTPFAYAPDTSFSLSVRHRLPLANGGELQFVGDYGWMGEYQRASSNERQPKNADGSNKPEPSYGILNARIVYELPKHSCRISVFGTNLTNEWYVNGGFDAGVFAGYDFGTIGWPRQIGAGVAFSFR
jgi:hypothetical protein